MSLVAFVDFPNVPFEYHYPKAPKIAPALEQRLLFRNTCFHFLVIIARTYYAPLKRRRTTFGWNWVTLDKYTTPSNLEVRGNERCFSNVQRCDRQRPVENSWKSSPCLEKPTPRFRASLSRNLSLNLGREQARTGCIAAITGYARPWMKITDWKRRGGWKRKQ